MDVCRLNFAAVTRIDFVSFTAGLTNVRAIPPSSSTHRRRRQEEEQARQDAEQEEEEEEASKRRCRPCSDTGYSFLREHPSSSSAAVNAASDKRRTDAEN